MAGGEEEINTASTAIGWLDDESEAFDAARNSGKPVLIDFRHPS